MIAFDSSVDYTREMRATTRHEPMWARRPFWVTILDAALVGVISLLSIGIGTIISTILLNGVE